MVTIWGKIIIRTVTPSMMKMKGQISTLNTEILAISAATKSWMPTGGLCSVAVDLKISQIVDVPNVIVSAFLPLDIFGSAASG